MSSAIRALAICRTIATRAPLGLALAAAAAYAVSGVTVVAPGELGIVLRFGRLQGGSIETAARQPGLVVAWPAPIDRVVRISAKQERRIEIDDFQGDLLDSSHASPPERVLSEDGDEGLETDDPSGDEAGEAVDSRIAARCALTGDSNLVGLRLTAKYLIASPVLHLTSAVDPDRLVRGVVACQAQRELARSSLDEALRMRRELESGPVDLSAIVLEGAQRELDRLDSGLTLTAIEVRAAGPPRAAAAAFSALQTARIEQETIRERITASANETLADSEALARQAIAEAKGLAELRRAAAADADTRIRSTLAGAAHANRRDLGERLRSEAWRDILRDCGQVHVVPRSGPESRLRLPTREGGNGR